MVADNAADEELRGTFASLVMQLVVEQPLKTPFVAAVVLLINSLKPDVVEAVLAQVARATEERIALGEWREVKLYLKFLACVQDCLEGDGVFPLLEELFNRAADLQTASSDDVRILTTELLVTRANTRRLLARRLLRLFSSRFRTSWQRHQDDSTRKRPS